MEEGHVVPMFSHYKSDIFKFRMEWSQQIRVIQRKQKTAYLALCFQLVLQNFTSDLSHLLGDKKQKQKQKKEPQCKIAEQLGWGVFTSQEVA